MATLLVVRRGIAKDKEWYPQLNCRHGNKTPSLCFKICNYRNLIPTKYWHLRKTQECKLKDFFNAPHHTHLGGGIYQNLAPNLTHKILLHEQDCVHILKGENAKR
jgi:hypothetical protein